MYSFYVEWANLKGMSIKKVTYAIRGDFETLLSSSNLTNTCGELPQIFLVFVDAISN